MNSFYGEHFLSVPMLSYAESLLWVLTFAFILIIYVRLDLFARNSLHNTPSIFSSSLQMICRIFYAANLNQFIYRFKLFVRKVCVFGMFSTSSRNIFYIHSPSNSSQRWVKKNPKINSWFVRCDVYSLSTKSIYFRHIVGSIQIFHFFLIIFLRFLFFWLMNFPYHPLIYDTNLSLHSIIGNFMIDGRWFEICSMEKITEKFVVVKR